MAIVPRDEEFAAIFGLKVGGHRFLESSSRPTTSARRGAERLLRNDIDLRISRHAPTNAHPKIQPGVEVIDRQIVPAAREVNLRVEADVADQSCISSAGLPSMYIAARSSRCRRRDIRRPPARRSGR